MDQLGKQINIRLETTLEIKGFFSNYNNVTVWIVVNGTNTAENGTRAINQRATIARAYAATIAIHSNTDMKGETPIRMRFVDWNESTQKTNADTFFVDNYDAWAWVNETITTQKFFNRWFRSSHAAPEWVEQKAEWVARATRNTTVGPENETESSLSSSHPV